MRTRGQLHTWMPRFIEVATALLPLLQNSFNFVRSMVTLMRRVACCTLLSWVLEEGQISSQYSVLSSGARFQTFAFGWSLATIPTPGFLRLRERTESPQSI